MTGSLRFPVLLNSGDPFPEPESALRVPDGLLAVGGDLSVDRLIDAYRSGIFPWFGTDQPILWWSPDPRAVLDPRAFVVSRSLCKRLRKTGSSSPPSGCGRDQEENIGGPIVWRVTCDDAFDRVVAACAAPRESAGEPSESDLSGAHERERREVDDRPVEANGGGLVHEHEHGCEPRQDWTHTWIVPEMQAAYSRLHRHGHAHSIEVWQGDDLIGGVYGVAVGRVFCGESMFHRVRDASKVALAWLCANLMAWGFEWVDIQQDTQHLRSLGATAVSRRRYLEILRRLAAEPVAASAWTELSVHPLETIPSRGQRGRVDSDQAEGLPVG
ncbi:MAG: leucyl/phenylalanyl-tRNA--protein transferase [Thioalkalivibrionaceae bacterium]